MGMAVNQHQAVAGIASATIIVRSGGLRCSLTPAGVQRRVRRFIVEQRAVWHHGSAYALEFQLCQHLAVNALRKVDRRMLTKLDL
eukprot:jgi/Chrpa1/3444/Chrysochromulina_OHIO_Genome00012011-RA